MRAQRVLLAAMEQDLKAADLPPLGWYDVLWELVRSGEGRLRPYEIEAHTLLAQHNLSRLLDRMEEAGLVRRETLPEDGRGRWVLVTEAGRAMQQRIWGALANSIRATGMPDCSTPTATSSAAPTEGNWQVAAETASGSPCKRSCTSVMMPSVPSLPRKRRVRS